MIYVPFAYVLIGLAVVSIASVAIVLADRSRAKNREKRIPELWMVLLGLFGGATAMFITMQLCRHKHRYPKFTIGLPLMTVLHVIFIVLAIQYGPEYTFMIDVPIEYLTAGIVGISVLASAITNLDKRNAQRDAWRVSEAWLMFIAAIGGATAMLITMGIIHHKTRYKKFMIGLPIMIVIHLALLTWIFLYCPFITIWTF